VSLKQLFKTYNYENNIDNTLVNWGMSTIITGVFAVVGVVMIFIVYHLVTADKKIQQVHK
jgi:hypothetical protein